MFEKFCQNFQHKFVMQYYRGLGQFYFWCQSNTEVSFRTALLFSSLNIGWVISLIGISQADRKKNTSSPYSFRSCCMKRYGFCLKETPFVNETASLFPVLNLKTLCIYITKHKMNDPCFIWYWRLCLLTNIKNKQTKQNILTFLETLCRLHHTLNLQYY